MDYVLDGKAEVPQQAEGPKTWLRVLSEFSVVVWLVILTAVIAGGVAVVRTADPQFAAVALGIYVAFVLYVLNKF